MRLYEEPNYHTDKKKSDGGHNKEDILYLFIMGLFATHCNDLDQDFGGLVLCRRSQGQQTSPRRNSRRLGGGNEGVTKQQKQDFREVQEVRYFG